MFYSQCLLSKKGPLGPVLVAAYFHKKLKKDLVTHTDISFSVDKILTEGVPVITYRVLGYLLLGVVRIYSKKVDYVLRECHRVKLNFKKSTLGMKTDARGGPLTEQFGSIILPERFELDAFDFELAEDFVEGNVMPPQEIMLHDASRSMEMWTFSLDEYCEGDPMPLEICVPEEVSLCVLPPEFMDIDEDRLLPGQNNSETRVEYLLDYTSFPGTSICFEMREDNEEQSPNLPRSIDEEHNVDTENLQLMEMYSSANGERCTATGAPEISAIVDVDPASNPPDVSNSLLIIMSDGIEERPQIHPESSSKEHDINTGKSQLLEMNSPNKGQRLNNQEESKQSVSIDTSLISNPPQVSDKIHFEISNEAEEQLAGLCRAAGKSQNTDVEKSQILEKDSQDGKKCTATQCPRLSVTIGADPVTNLPDVSGAATPDFMTVRTPANKEHGRHLGKRKFLVDSDIVLPNKVLRKCIHDSSGLIRPRMRAPHTVLNAWRADIIPNLSFLDSLVPCNSEELRSLFSSYNERKSVRSVSEKDASEKLGFSGSSSPSKSSEQKAAAPETPVQQSISKAPDKKDKEISDSPKSAQIILSPEEPTFAPETPAQRPTSMAFFDTPEVTSSAGGLLLKPINNTGKDILLSEDVPESDHHMVGISKVIKFFGKDPDAQTTDGWSARTRTMARFLKKSFSEKTKHQEEEVVNMSQVLQGQTREDSSRVFYEVLVLKTKSVIEVQQESAYGESAYGDILVRESSRWLECCEELGL